MAKAPNLPNLTGQYMSTTQINAAYEAIEEAFQNTLSRDGSAPNFMEADLDMNSNDILNVRGIQADSFIVDGEDFSELLQRAIQEIQAALALAEMVTFTRVTLTYTGNGTSDPLILPLSLTDARYVDVFVNETRKYPTLDYTVNGYDLIPTDHWTVCDEDNILVLINKPYDNTAPTTDDITYNGTTLTSVLNSLLSENIVRLTDFLHPDDYAAIVAGSTAGQSVSRVTEAIQLCLETALNKMIAVDGAQITVDFPPGNYGINNRLMSDTFNNTLWSAPTVTRSRLWFRTSGSVTFRLQNWVPGRASIRTDGIYSGSSHIAPNFVFEWIQNTGRQNFGGMTGQWIIEGGNNTASDPSGFYFYRLNATHILGDIECRNLRNRNFVFDSCFNSKFDYVRSGNAAGLMLTECGNTGLLANDSVSGTITTGLRYTISGTTLTLNTMVYDSSVPSYSYTPANIFTADHVGKWIGLDRQGRENLLGDDIDDGNEGGSTRRSARWFQIASVTDASTAELTVAPSYQTGVDQWVPQNRTFSFEVLKVSTTAGSTVATLSMPTTLNLVGLEVVIPGAGYDGSAPRFPDLVAMVVGHSGSSITLSHAAKVSKSGVPLVTAPQLALSSLSHTVFASTSRKCDDVHFGRMWAESGAVPALPLHLHNVTNISTGRDSKLHGSPPSNPNFGANFACVMAGEVGATLNGRFTHSRHSRQFGMFYITGDRSELDIDDAELSSWTADDQTSIWYLDPANVATTRIWDIYFNARDYAHGFPSTAAGQVFERGSANWTAGRIKAGSSQKNPRGERPSWPPAYLPPARAPAYGSTYEDATSAQTRGWSPEAGVTYRIAGSDYLGVTAGTGNDGFNSLQGLKKPLVILAWGQSNTAGNGTGGSLRLNPRVRIFDTDASVPVAGTLFNRAAFGVRPIDKTSSGQPVNNAIAHAASRLADELDVDVYVIMVARGGVSIEAFLTDAILTANSWSRGAWPDLSGLVLDSLTAALPLVPGTPTTVDMVMSVHGEANRTDAPTVYADKYMALMTMLSDAGRIDKRNVRLVAGEISTNAHTRYYENHKAALDDIDQRFGSVSLPGFVPVSSVGIDVNAGDETHFSGYGLVEYGRRLANAALSRTIRNAIGTTRAHAVAACARGWRAGDGLLYDIDGRKYKGSTGATTLSDLPGLVPASRTVSAAHFALAGDDSTDDAVKFMAAMDWLEAQGGGEFVFEPHTYRMSAVTQPSRVTVRLNGATIKVHPSTPKTGDWWTNRSTNTTTSDRTCFETRIIGPGTLDSSLRPFDRWLSKADGTPITDPEADYVAGSGALASGITGVSLTAVLAADVVASVTVNAGGSGWNDHPTHPYVPSTVPLKFTGGGGTGARGYATIAGGTITSVTVEYGGTGYTSPPTVTTMGGYADISLLVEPSVDRRNAEYSTTGSGVAWRKIVRPRVENVRFTGFRGRSLLDIGCLDAAFHDCSFDDCGKNDGPYHAIWAQSYGNPAAPDASFADTENITIERCSFVNLERSGAMFSPTKGGRVRKCRFVDCGESSVLVDEKGGVNGGILLIEDNVFDGGVITDIVGNHVEAGRARNLHIVGNRFRASPDQALILTGTVGARVLRNEFVDCVSGLTSLPGFLPYGPFSERYAYNAGSRPIAGEAYSVAVQHVVRLGTLEGVGCDNLIIADNSFRDSRASGSHPAHLFATQKTGGNSLSGTTRIEGNDVTGLPSGMAFIDASTSTVFSANMPLRIRDNAGHASEAPVIMEASITATGSLVFEPGFRPSVVMLEAVTSTPTNFRYGTGKIVWRRDATRNDYSMSLATDGTNHQARNADTEAVRIIDPTNTTVLGVEFVSWKETGFTLNVITRTTNCTLKMVCYP